MVTMPTQPVLCLQVAADQGCTVAPEGSSVEGSPSHGAPSATTEGPEDNMAPAEGLPGPLPQDARQGALSCSSSVLDLSQSGLRHLGELLRVPSLQVRGSPAFR